MDNPRENENLIEEKFLPKELPKEIPDHLGVNPIEHNQLKTLISWSAPGRPFIKRGRQFYMTAILIVFLIEIILFLFSQYLAMFVVASLLFMGFAFSLIPPRDFHYKITTQGVMIEDHFYLWRELYDFYFKRKEGHDFLHIRTEDIFPGEIIISLGDVHKDQVIQTMIQYIPYREYVKPDIMDRTGEWLYKNFPLEKRS